MKLIVYCKNCKNEGRVKGNFANRWELSAARGKEFELKCPNCNHTALYSVDNVQAKAGKIGVIALLLTFLCSAVIILLLYPYSIKGIIPVFLLPMGVLIPSLIYAAILREQKRRIETFNSTRPNSLKSIKFTKRY
jgi:hypothetical protein